MRTPAGALALAVTLGLAACGDGSGEAATTTTAAPPPSTTTSTVATTSSSMPATTTSGAVGQEVTGEGTRFGPPEAGTPERTQAGETCDGVAQENFTTVACAVAGDMTALVEQAGPAAGPAVEGELLAWVFERDGSSLVPKLIAFAAPGELDGATLATGDLDGDGTDEFAFGFRTAGTGQFLDIDVVGRDATVVVHRSALHHGRAAVSGGQLETWTAVYDADTPECCPTSFQHEVIAFVDGAYHLTSSTPVAPDTVPAGEL